MSSMLVAGSIIGVRCWRYSDAGFLMPMNMHQAPPWEPGWNQCRCFREQMFGNCGDPDCVECQRSRATGKPHTFHPECQCGFYAVFRPRHIPYGQPSVIQGVIEGRGKSVVGPEGFRISEAKILALVDIGWNRLFSQYPGVALFSSIQRAVREFPPTDPLPLLAAAP